MKIRKKSGRYIAHLLAVLMIMTAFTAAYGGAALQYAYANDDEAWAVDIYTKEGDEERTDNGNIAAPDCGVRIWTKNGYNASYTLNGALTAENRGINPSAEGGGKLTATVNGDLTAKNQDAVYATARKASTSELTFGNVKGGYTGISAGAEDGSNITLKAGSVTAGGVDDPNHDNRAVVLEAEGDGSLVSAEIGDVESDQYGLDILASDDGEVQLTAGNVTSASTGLSTDLDSSPWAPGGSSYITTGTISSINGYGISCMSMSGSPVSNVMNVKGNVSGSAYGAFLYGSGKSNTSLSVYGDVISTKEPEEEKSYAGIFCNNDSDILVTGTVSGKDNALIANGKMLDLTVWKLEAGSGELIKSSNNDIKDSIKYIVKTKQPYEAQGSISVTKADGSELDTSHDLDVAHEGDELVVSVELKEGSVLKGVFNGEEELKADAEGKYHVVMPEGGGISISAVIEGNEEPPQHVHSLVKTERKEATCTEEGCEEYWKCSDPSCGKIFADENAENETTPEELFIDKKDHSWDKGRITKVATLLRKGEKTYTCTVCGAKMTVPVTFKEAVKDLGNKIEEWIKHIFSGDDIDDTDPEDPDDGSGIDGVWADSIYVLGHQINNTNCNDVLGDGGSVSYDHESRTITLKDATLDLKDFYVPSGVETNQVYGINAWRETTIVLEGTNTILSSSGRYYDGAEYVYGITSSYGANIIGDGSLDIVLDKKADNSGILAWYGIEGSMSLSIDGAEVNVIMDGLSARCDGIYSGYKGMVISGGAKVSSRADGAGSCAVYDGSYGKTSVDAASSLEMLSDNSAFEYTKLSAEMTEAGALVNKDDTPDGAVEWDKTSRLTDYKYIRFPYSGERTVKYGIYVLGNQITDNNCDDVLGDGTVSYDAGTNTLKLSKAAIDLAKYKDPVSDSNIVAGVYVWDSDAIRIELEGRNLIYSSTGNYGTGKEFVLGLNLNGPTVMTGSGSLEVNLKNDASNDMEFIGVYSEMKMTVDGCMIDVMMSGSGANTGLELWTPPAFKNGALVSVVAEGQSSKAVTGTTAIGNTEISDDSVLEMISEGCAFNCYKTSDSLKAMGALVNNRPTAEGASAWNKTTYLGTFKYVRFPGDSRSGETVKPVVPVSAEVADLPAVKILKPKASKRAITVRWKKVSSSNKKKIEGIEIEYRAKGISKIKTAGKKARSKKIKGLKSKKKYTVRIRSYKYVNNVKHVSKWSAWKSVKVK